MDQTIQQYQQVMAVCREVFKNKMKDYGTAWRILRPESITDQIYIKARRIRSIEDKGVMKVDEDPRDEFYWYSQLFDHWIDPVRPWNL